MANCKKKASDPSPYFRHFFLETNNILKSSDSQALADLATVICTVTNPFCQQLAFVCATEVRCARSQLYVPFNSPNCASCQSQQKNEAVSQALKQTGRAKLCLLASSNALPWEGEFKRVLFP